MKDTETEKSEDLGKKKSTKDNSRKFKDDLHSKSVLKDRSSEYIPSSSKNKSELGKDVICRDISSEDVMKMPSRNYVEWLRDCLLPNYRLPNRIAAIIQKPLSVICNLPPPKKEARNSILGYRQSVSSQPSTFAHIKDDMSSRKFTVAAEHIKTTWSKGKQDGKPKNQTIMLGYNELIELSYLLIGSKKQMTTFKKMTEISIRVIFFTLCPKFVDTKNQLEDVFDFG